jgi:hypothetical protein
MRRHRLLPGTRALALLALTGRPLVTPPAPTEPGVTRQTFRRLRAGMKRSEVKAASG